MANPFGRLWSLAKRVAGGQSKANFIVVDVQRRSMASMTSATQHEQRTAGDLSHVDFERTHLNKRVAYNGNDSPKKAVEDYIKDKGVQFDKRNTTPITSLVLSASPDFFDMKNGIADKEKLDEWSKATMGWAIKTFGDDMVHCALHLDEKTPHFHIFVVPTYEKKTKHKTVIQGSHSKCWAFGGRGSYHRLWDTYAASVAHLGLNRGEKVPEGARGTHKTAREWVNAMARRMNGFSMEAARLDEREKRVGIREIDIEAREVEVEAREKTVSKREASLIDQANLLPGQEAREAMRKAIIEKQRQASEPAPVRVEKRARRSQTLKGRPREDR